MHVVEPFSKSFDKLELAWTKEPLAVTYNIYVGLNAVALTQVASNISGTPSQYPSNLGKISYTVPIEDVQAALGLATTKDYSNTVFYFAHTYVDMYSAESSQSTVVEVPPVGITPRFMKDDPTIRRHGYVFSPELQRWVKGIGSESGAMVVDTADFFKTNITTDYTYDGTNISTIKSYMSDATTGSPAKLTTYSYAGSLVTKIVITDSTV